MKKRIIASILVVVMLVLALVSCGSYDFTEENLDEYVTFDYEAFVKGLGEIKIEDGDFTGDPETRKKKIDENIFAAFSSTVLKDVKTFESDKLTSGKVGVRDIVYFCYYAADKDGNIYYSSNMKESSITASSTSSKHMIELGDADVTDEFLKLVMEALKEYDFGTDGENAYSMFTATALDGVNVKAGDTVIVSYTVEWNNYKKDDNGAVIKDENGKPIIEGSTSYKATYEKVEVKEDSESALGRYLYSLVSPEGNKNTVKVGVTVKKSEKNSEGKDVNTETHKIEEAEGESLYSGLKIEWREDNAGAPVSVEYNPFDKDTDLEPDSRHASSKKNTIKKDDKLTYYVYPVYHLSVPAEINAYNIIRYVIGSSIDSSSLDVLASEDYKNGDTTVKALVEALAKVYDEDYEDGSELAKLLKAYEDAAKAVKDAGKNATEEQEAAEEEAELKYLTAQRNEISALCEKIAGATSSEADAKSMDEVLIAEHKENVEHSLEEKYQTAISEAVEKAVYELIFGDGKNDGVAKLTGEYPEELVDDFVDHLHEKYEYNFYKGTDSTTKKSNYTQYNGDLQAYLLVATGAKEKNISVDKALTEEAKEAIGPLLKLYACAKACAENGAADELVTFIEADIAAGAYEPTYDDDADADEKKEADEEAAENKAEALKNAKNFLITEEVFEDYKKTLGRAAYRNYEEAYGEINIRASLQFNRLFYYLTSYELEKDENDHMHAKTEQDENNFIRIKFRKVAYTIKADEAEDTEAED